ncbi:MAG: GNAT family acetyltransferase [Rhodomicrobium sp.]|nr:MAG: GNAT family acetyltransferase [Rhodomicrobium sp.]
MGLIIKPLTGAAMSPYLDDVARLRLSVFAEYPYLYDGDLEYETWYLAKFASLAGAVLVVALDGDKVIGAATGAPLLHQFEEFSAPLIKAGYDIDQHFYCGESVLVPPYRGRGIGHEFFNYREAQAVSLGLAYCGFFSVIRAEDDPRRPDGYRSLDGFWNKRGYEKLDGVVATFPWREQGENFERMNQLCYWMRAL